jgi:hypothetical protein
MGRDERQEQRHRQARVYINPNSPGRELLEELVKEVFPDAERVSRAQMEKRITESLTEELVSGLEDRTAAFVADAHIAAYGTFKPKAAIKDLGLALRFSSAETDAIAGLISDEYSLTANIKMDPRLQELIKFDPRVKTLMEFGLRLEEKCRRTEKS